MWPGGAACRLLKTNSGLSMRERWLRKSARQGAGFKGVECEVLAMVRVVGPRVRERCARRSLGAMVALGTMLRCESTLNRELFWQASMLFG